MAKPNKRPKAIFSIAKTRKIGDFLIRVKAIVLSIGNTPSMFATPSPALATITTAINALEAAESVAQTRVLGSAAARDLAYDEVLDLIYALMAYVQTLADNADDESMATAIIAASGFNQQSHGSHAKAPISAKTKAGTGSVKLTAKASDKKAVYEWQQSPNGSTWTDLPVTLKASTYVSGLTPATVMWFRVRAVLNSGPEAWTSPVEVVIT